MIAESEITPRESEILNLAVNGYIMSAQPVSSQYIAENYEIGLSSATIRSVFSDLEFKGFLYSPHRSAGRIPTEKGYRYYTENLREKWKIPEDDRKLIQEEYLKKSFEVDQILEVTTKILTMLTNYASVVIGPEPDQTVLKHIELIDMGQDEILMIILTRSGVVYNKTLHIENRIPSDYLRKISSYLNNVFKGCDLREIKDGLQNNLDSGLDFKQFFPMIAKTISANFEAVKNEEEFYFCGVDKLMTQINKEKRGPEELGSLFESGGFLKKMIKKTGMIEDVMVFIHGDKDVRLKGLSIVTAGYKMGGRNIGALGIVGPNRMDYFRIMSLVDFMSRLMSNMLTKISN